MKVSVEKLPSSEALLEVDLSWEELEKASDKAYRKLVQKVDVHGFRRGKAPRSILERKLGKESIYQEALDDLITETYRSAVKEHELTPLAQPELDAPIFEMGQPYHFSLKVAILSPVTLGDYRSLHFDREEPEVTSEEVEKELENLQSRRTTWNVVERPAQIGDRVTVDLNAGTLAGLSPMLGRFAPQPADVLRRAADRAASVVAVARPRPRVPRPRRSRWPGRRTRSGCRAPRPGCNRP